MLKDELLKVYRHEDIGYVPIFPTDYNIIGNPLIREKGFGGGLDWFGVNWTQSEGMTAVTPVPGEVLLKDVCRWREEIVFPDLDALPWESMACSDELNWDRENKITLAMLECGPFERLQSLLGFENALIAMYDEPEETKALIDAITEHRKKLVRLVCKYYSPDVVCLHDDFGAGDRMIISPELWRRFFKDSVKILTETAHKCGAFYEHHSCGFIRPIVPELVELGVDAINPMQSSNGVPELKAEFGNRLTFCGGFDNQHVFDNIFANEEEIREEVRRVYNALMPGGSYVAFIMTFSDRSMKIINDELKRLQKTI